jgi:hypothetical protein
VSDRRRDAATYAARLKEKEREIAALRHRLKVLRDCTERRCHLCLDCLNAAWDEDYGQDTPSPRTETLGLTPSTGQSLPPTVTTCPALTIPGADA